jgi:hypothetical protein
MSERRSTAKVLFGAAAMAALAALPLVSGCLIGPEDNEDRLLVESKWKHKRQRPTLVDPDYQYVGERFEEAYYTR